MNSALTLLAFDYGLKQIGVASGQTATSSASPLTVLKARDGIPQWEHIAQLLEEWRPDRVLVGLPLNMDGSESELSTRARKFANRLHGRFGVAVEMVDERLTSFAAKAQQQAAGGSTDYRKNPVDALAAKMILEDWFNAQHQAPAT